MSSIVVHTTEEQNSTEKNISHLDGSVDYHGRSNWESCTARLRDTIVASRWLRRRECNDDGCQKREEECFDGVHSRDLIVNEVVKNM